MTTIELNFSAGTVINNTYTKCLEQPVHLNSEKEYKVVLIEENLGIEYTAKLSINDVEVLRFGIDDEGEDAKQFQFITEAKIPINIEQLKLKIYHFNVL